MRRKSNRNTCVACTIDRDIFASVSAQNRSSSRALHCCDVIDGLKKLFDRVELISVDHNDSTILRNLAHLRPDVVFNLALSGNEDACLFVSLLEQSGVPFTGASSKTIALLSNKYRSQVLLNEAGIKVPRLVLISNRHQKRIPLIPPFLLKILDSGGSYGISRRNIIRNPHKAAVRIAEMGARFGFPLLCEEFVRGREIRAAVIEVRPRKFDLVSFSEWIFPPNFRGEGIKTELLKKNSKYRNSKKIRNQPANLTSKLKHDLSEVVQRCLKVFDISGYAAIDLRITDAGNIFVIDVNPNPGLTKSSLSWSAPSFETNLQKIVEAAMFRNRCSHGGKN